MTKIRRNNLLVTVNYQLSKAFQKHILHCFSEKYIGFKGCTLYSFLTTEKHELAAKVMQRVICAQSSAKLTKELLGFMVCVR